MSQLPQSKLIDKHLAQSKASLELRLKRDLTEEEEEGIFCAGCAICSEVSALELDGSWLPTGTTRPESESLALSAGTACGNSTEASGRP